MPRAGGLNLFSISFQLIEKSIHLKIGKFIFQGIVALLKILGVQFESTTIN